MQRIGVLGGLGPQATMDFVARLHRASQAARKPTWNMGYPPLVVAFHRAPPMKMDEEFEPVLPLQPEPTLLEAARHLGALSDFLVIPSNTPHLFYDEIRAAAGCEVLHLPNLAMRAVEERGWRHVGVLEVVDPRIYPPLLTSMDVRFSIADEEHRTALTAAIQQVMEGRDTPESKEVLRAAIQNLRAKGVEGLILGCTEIPLLLPDDLDASDLVNPAQLLAEAAVAKALDEG